MLAMIAAVTAPLLLVGLIVYWMFSAYWKVEDSSGTSYGILTAQALPGDLNRIASQLRRLGFHFLATFGLLLPSQQSPPNQYAFQDEEGAVKVLLAQRGPFKSVTFQTMFSDGWALNSVRGIRRSPFPQGACRLSERLYLWGSLALIYQEHREAVARMAKDHGAPLRTLKAEEYQRLLNRCFVLPYHARVARSALRLYRVISVGILSAYALIVALFIAPPLAAGARTEDVLDLLWALLVPLPLLPLTFVAWWLSWKINRRVLPRVASMA